MANFPERKGVKERLRELAQDEIGKVRTAAFSGIGKVRDTGATRFLYDALFKEVELSKGKGDAGKIALFVLSAAFRHVVGEEDCVWLSDGLAKENPIEVRFTLFEAVADKHCSDGE